MLGYSHMKTSRSLKRPMAEGLAPVGSDPCDSASYRGSRAQCEAFIVGQNDMMLDAWSLVLDADGYEAESFFPLHATLSVDRVNRGFHACNRIEAVIEKC